MTDHPRLGILMLDTSFPRIPGDVGNPDSFDFPVTYRRVPGATPEAVVEGDSRRWIDAFIREGTALVQSGCTGLATTCGFLTLVRSDIATACGVPVASSSLEQIPLLATLLPQDRTVGILTISRASLTGAHLAAAQVPQGVPIEGMDGSHFATTILRNAPDLDIARARDEMITAAKRLCHDHPYVAAIVLECTNMPPYAADIARATGRPVYSILSYLNWFHNGLQPARYAGSE
ncbi:aspartate/glutamate racemase family protein [Marivita sp. S6314]|uniref:aspartate/glutamate racemase family protein n=1 Tax=Marivita sp. S6314 TaxID=2926406 RepID=UPI001FF1CBC7|nr:aspartate/glutamate racemase family protein [Marivita sp. S6314]MCK0149739.1 aspartate/glutamate racemase family protein [Marivita sp. S6314]